MYLPGEEEDLASEFILNEAYCEECQAEGDLNFKILDLTYSSDEITAYVKCLECGNEFKIYWCLSEDKY